MSLPGISSRSAFSSTLKLSSGKSLPAAVALASAEPVGLSVSFAVSINSPNHGFFRKLVIQKKSLKTKGLQITVTKMPEVLIEYTRRGQCPSFVHREMHNKSSLVAISQVHEVR